MSHRSPWRPHNARAPIDIRKHPVCYLCGGKWSMPWEKKYRGKRDGVRSWLVTVQCDQCKLLTAGYADWAVMHAREWAKHRRKESI